MPTINDFINEAVERNTSGKKVRKTKNSELYLKILTTLVQDDEYVSVHIKEVNNGELVTENLKLAPEFRKIIASAVKKASSMSDAEAMEFAKGFKLSASDADTLAKVVHETDYVAMKCGKKVPLYRKPDLDIAMTIEQTKETVRKNPKDPTKATRIKAHDRAKVETTIHAFLKTPVKVK